MANCNIYTIKTFTISDKNIELAKVKNIKFVGVAEACFKMQTMAKAMKDAINKENISQIGIDKNTKIDVIFPEQELISNNILNNNSLVAKLTYEDSNKQEYSLLLTGDIEKVAEKKLVEKYINTGILEATILKVAHHGSKTSSIEEILKLIKPKIALIGVGEKNTFGHPSKITLDNLQSADCQIYRTDISGQITITITGGKIRVKKKIS